MRIHRPKLKLPNPLTVLACAMVIPLYAVIITASATPQHETDLTRLQAFQVVEVQADKLWRKVAAVPQRLRAQWHDYRAS